MMRRILGLAAGVLGAAGIAGAAAASHGGDARLLSIASAIALVHAPSLLALAAFPAEAARGTALPATLMIAGTVLFSGDLVMRAIFETPLFAMAAPIGGGMLILAWLGVALVAAMGPRPQR